MRVEILNTGFSHLCKNHGAYRPPKGSRAKGSGANGGYIKPTTQQESRRLNIVFSGPPPPALVK